MSEIWPIELSYARPMDRLYAWRVLDIDGLRRFSGLANRARVPMVTDAIVQFDPDQRQGTTKTGHVYALAEKPAPVAVGDVTAEVVALMATAVLETKMSYKEFKCPKCGWVHAAISRAEAEAQVASANEYDAAGGRPQTNSIEHYLRCFRCGAPTSGFVPAAPGDAPTGSTIQGVVVPGAWELP